MGGGGGSGGWSPVRWTPASKCGGALRCVLLVMSSTTSALVAFVVSKLRIVPPCSTTNARCGSVGDHDSCTGSLNVRLGNTRSSATPGTTAVPSHLSATQLTSVIGWTSAPVHEPIPAITNQRQLDLRMPRTVSNGHAAFDAARFARFGTGYSLSQARVTASWPSH